MMREKDTTCTVPRCMLEVRVSSKLPAAALHTACDPKASCAVTCVRGSCDALGPAVFKSPESVILLASAVSRATVRAREQVMVLLLPKAPPLSAAWQMRTHGASQTKQARSEKKATRQDETPVGKSIRLTTGPDVELRSPRPQGSGVSDSKVGNGGKGGIQHRACRHRPC